MGDRFLTVRILTVRKLTKLLSVAFSKDLCIFCPLALSLCSLTLSLRAVLLHQRFGKMAL